MTLHIHLTINHSIRSSSILRLCRFATFIAQVSVNTLWTQALYIFPFMWYDALPAVRIRDYNSFNLSQAHLKMWLLPPPLHLFPPQCVRPNSNYIHLGFYLLTNSITYSCYSFWHWFWETELFLNIKLRIDL